MAYASHVHHPHSAPLYISIPMGLGVFIAELALLVGLISLLANSYHHSGQELMIFLGAVAITAFVFSRGRETRWARRIFVSTSLLLWGGFLTMLIFFM